MIEVIVYLSFSGACSPGQLLSVPESPPMGHHGTLVVAGLSDHTVKLTPYLIFACPEVVNCFASCKTLRLIHSVPRVLQATPTR